MTDAAGDGAAGDGLISVHILGGLALAEAATGNHDDARAHAARAVALARAIPMGGFLLMALCRATEVAGLIGDDAMGVEALDELLATLRQLGSRQWVSGALEAAVALLPSGDADQATVEARLLGTAGELRTRMQAMSLDVVQRLASGVLTVARTRRRCHPAPQPAVSSDTGCDQEQSVGLVPL